MTKDLKKETREVYEASIRDACEVRNQALRGVDQAFGEAKVKAKKDYNRELERG